MTPLVITAELASPPVVTGPLLLDALLYAAAGAALGMAHLSGWVAEEDVIAAGLPLARVETPHGWWWAASQATPIGPESVSHCHRRPMFEAALEWGITGSIGHKTWPDKALRKPQYRRLMMTRLRWTCAGEAQEIARLLCLVPGIGPYRTHGHGWVRRWGVEAGGPPVEDYARDLDLRHLPMDAVADLPSRVTRRRIPLTPPYWHRHRAVDVWQVPEETP